MAKVVIKRADERYLPDICELEKLCFKTPWPVEVLYEGYMRFPSSVLCHTGKRQGSGVCGNVAHT